MARVTVVPCLNDNYAYLLEDEASGEVAVVDASEAEPVLRALEERRVEPSAILSTHHHHDHVGGNQALARRYPSIKVYGHASDRGRIPAQTELLEHGSSFALGESVVRALHVPGHTLGAVSYWVDDALFTGDTLFAAGCGRLFEGTPAGMFRSLNELLASLDPAVRVFCGHEYTVSNLLFAATVEPHNARVSARLEQARALRARREPTVGGSMADELATNPFLRCDEPEVRRHAGVEASASAIDVFAALRKQKDAFKPGK